MSHRPGRTVLAAALLAAALPAGAGRAQGEAPVLRGAQNARGVWLPASAEPKNWVSTRQRGATLTGAAGADALYSPGGRATLAGGAGDDSYWVWEHTDRVVEAPGSGVDTVVSFAPRFALPDGVENLAVAAPGAHGMGNALANLVVGGEGAQTLDGGPGDDVLTGGPGADTFTVLRGNGSDAIADFAPGEDVVRLGGAGLRLTSFAAVRAALTQAGADAVLDLGGGETLTFRGRSAADLSAADFRLPVDVAALLPAFADEFDDPAAFRATPDGLAPATGRPVWRTVYHWGERGIASNAEAGFYSDATVGPDPFRVAGGVLEVTAAPATGLPAGLTHTSGLITTQASFSQTYGYFEVRAQLPAGAGFWPAFWLLPSDLSWPPEIDVFEMLGHEPGVVYTTAHTASNGTRTKAGAMGLVADTSAGFRTYAVSWRPDRIRWFVDGAEVFTAPTPRDMHKPFYMLANLGVGGPGSWPGPAAPEATGVMRIDHIRAYQFPDLAAPRRRTRAR